MMEWGIVSGLWVLIVMGSLASVGWDQFEMRNRENWWWTAVLGLEVLLVPNPYLAAVVAVFTLGLFQIGRAWYILRGIVIPTAALVALYSLLVPVMNRAMIGPILWACVTVGVGLGLWAVVGLVIQDRPFTRTIPQSWWGMWGIYEHLSEHQQRHICGQGNTLHLVSVSSITVAACVGLLVMGQWWAALALPFCLLPMGLVWWLQVSYDVEAGVNVPDRWQPGQTMLNLWVLGVGLCAIYAPIVAVGSIVAMGVCGGAALWMLKPWAHGHRSIDSGRLAYWLDALTLVWWPAGWKRRLFGFGTSTWFLATIRMGEARKHPNVYSAAHNEYLQQLVEHGLIGLAVLLAYLGEALWRTWHGGPDGQAVFLLGLMVCAIATINFPWTFFHEYHPPMKDGKPNHQEEWYGSPTLNVLCFVVALLVELIR